MGASHIWIGARLTLLVIVVTACSDSRTDTHTGRASQASTGVGEWRIVQAVDFNGDGLADALWTNTRTGQIAISLLRGTQLLEGGPALPGPAGEGWGPITGADFSLDGMADVPWFNSASPQLAIWLMHATHLADPGAPIPGPAGAGWAAIMAGDCNGDGMADVLWYDAQQGLMTVWLTRGASLFEPGPVLPAPTGEGWVVPNIADFNGDGLGDLFWFNTVTGRFQVYLMHGASVFERGPETPGPGSGWVAITTSDFNGDGMVDVIWNNHETNRMAIWLMHATSVLEAGAEIPGPPGGGWSVGSANDTDGDGLADAVWQNIPATQMAVWTMNGTHVVVPGPALPGPR